MSETDSFIEEVSEEVRRDKLYGYVKKFGWIAAVVVVVVVVVGAVGITAFLELQKSREAAAAQDLGDQIFAAIEIEDRAATAEALGAVAVTAGAAADIVSLRQAGELLAAGDKEGALAVLDRVASGSTEQVYRDLALLKSLLIRGADMDQEARAASLATLAQPGQTFRPMAMEQQAIMAMEAGDNDAANALFAEILLDSQSTDGLRSRARQMIVALGGEVPDSSELLSSE